MPDRFTGKCVLVTGAVGGLGDALVRGFAAEGASVVIGSRHQSEGEALAREVGNKSISVDLDVTSRTDWEDTVGRAERDIGPVSVLVNNAAFLAKGGVETVSLEDWSKVLETNVTGALLGMRAVVPSMRKAGGGAIVNVNSIAGLTGAPDLVAYGASKWAIRGMTKTAAMEFARDKIRVNGFHAGIVNTPLAFDKETGKELVPVDKFAIPRQASTQEMTGFVLFISSEDAAFATGSEFVADGGFLLGPLA